MFDRTGQVWYTEHTEPDASINKENPVIFVILSVRYLGRNASELIVYYDALCSRRGRVWLSILAERIQSKDRWEARPRMHRLV